MCSKLINKAVDGTIDERTINKTNLNVHRRLENQNLGINSASAIGCSVVNVGHNDFERGIPHIVLGLIWQIIRVSIQIKPISLLFISYKFVKGFLAITFLAHLSYAQGELL